MNSGGFGQIASTAILGLWSLLLVTGMTLTFAGAYRKYSGHSWKPFFFPGMVLFVVLMTLTLLNADYYAELSNGGWFELFTRSFIFLLPVILIGFGSSLCTHPTTRLPGALFIAAGLLGALSCIPFIVDPVLKIVYGDTTFTKRGMIPLSLPYQQQVNMLRLLAEAAGMIGLFSYLKHQKIDSTAAIVPSHADKPLFKQS